MRTASLPEERWPKQISEWNPGLDSSVKTSMPVERPRKRWEDEINEFLKTEESEETKVSDLKTMAHGYDRQRNRRSGK